MFRGINAVNLDTKGRMAIPMRYRSLLQEANNQVVLTIDTEDPCLLLYSLPDWEAIEQKLQALPSFNRAARRVQRLLLGHATELELDGSGRILLPVLLRDYAQLDKEVMLVGQGKKFEIWSNKLWETGRKDWISGGTQEDKEFPAEIMQLSI